MLIDGRQIEPGSLIQTQVCIIGAGAAGITIARELARERIPCVLLESGDFSFDGPTQALYRGETDGPDGKGYLETSRLRFFGGSTNHWAGNCRPLDPIDLESKPWIPDSGWPFGRTELDQWYPQASVLCGLGPFDDFASPARSFASANATLPPLARIATALFQTGPPVRFGAVYRDELIAAEDLTVHTHANVLGLHTNRDGNRVEHVEVSSLDGLRYEVFAQQFVLATGGIENARILLLSDHTYKRGIGNSEDLVGRYFSEHVGVLGAGLGCFWRPSESLAHFMAKPPTVGSDLYKWNVFTPNARTQREQQLRNAAIRLIPLHKKRRLLALARQDDSRLKAICANTARLDALRLGQPIAAYSSYRLRVIMELGPNPANRVTLDPIGRDALGQPLARLRWNPSADDLNSMWRVLETFAEDVGRAGFGRVRINREPKAWSSHPSKHHMGTTRMHSSPKRGVVDMHCRVHGVGNLSVAGSSVFPTYGYANPTLTIVALALRLAARLVAERRPAPG